MLKINNLSVYYGKAIALRNVNIEIGEREFVIILGSNGAGKTTLLRTVSGLNKQIEGSIEFLGKDITKSKSHDLVKLGIAHCPERRKTAPKLTVEENLMIGAYTLKSKEIIAKNLEKVYDTFPVLDQRKKQLAGTLSGGERGMLAIGRALMINPKLLLLDEPSQGLQPSLRVLLVEKLRTLLKEVECSILLAEQDAYFALELCERGYILENGSIVLEGDKNTLMNTDVVKKAYLGI